MANIMLMSPMIRSKRLTFVFEMKYLKSLTLAGRALRTTSEELIRIMRPKKGRYTILYVTWDERSIRKRKQLISSPFSRGSAQEFCFRDASSGN